MPGLATLLAFGALAIVVIVVPEPSSLYVVGRGISEGRRTAAASAIGARLRRCRTLARRASRFSGLVMAGDARRTNG